MKKFKIVMPVKTQFDEPTKIPESEITEPGRPTTVMGCLGVPAAVPVEIS